MSIRLIGLCNHIFLAIVLLIPMNNLLKAAAIFRYCHLQQHTFMHVLFASNSIIIIIYLQPYP